jgi:aryl-alcohol dehydrogenase-like predicted oxidoreductase
MTFGSQTDEAGAQPIVDSLLDAGINFFDTANMYNLGLAETILGKALGPRRKDVIVASKVFNKMGDGPDDSGLSRAAMRKAIEESLKRLGTDYLDLYYLHQPDWATPIEETLATMDELVRAGKVRYPAVSNYAAWQVRVWIARSTGKPLHLPAMYSLIAPG